jgi:hypothetical protein
LTQFPGEAKLAEGIGRSGRVVECAGLENRWARKGPVSSNLTSSVCLSQRDFFPGSAAWKLPTPKMIGYYVRVPFTPGGFRRMF